MSIPQRKVDALPDLRDAANETAWEKRTTMSALIRDGLTRYIEEPAFRSKIANVTDTPGTEIRLTFRVEDELWDAATERAAVEGDSLASVVRRILHEAADSLKAHA